MRVVSLHFLFSAVIAALSLSIIPGTFSYPFLDVSTQVGLDYSRGIRKKYGGACVADINADGFPDLMLAHHDEKFAEVYLGSRFGKFYKLPWNYWDDTHAFVPFRATPNNKMMHFMLQRGGSYGKKPTAPLVFSITNANQLIMKRNPWFPSGRGRTAAILPLYPSSPGINNAIIINAASKDRSKPHIFGAKVLPNGYLQQISLFGMEKERSWFASVTDVDGDGRMELITFQDLRIYKNTSPLKMTDISGAVLPNGLLPILGVVAVAELDYDNDGKMDLYVARTATGDLGWLRGYNLKNDVSDYLFRNVGGRYVDVTRKARIPLGGESRGVTAGDFNNDGQIDLLVSRYKEPYRLLLNNGDGTFRQAVLNFERRPTSHGDAPVAVDYDRDGKVDIILSEGDFIRRENGGQYRVMKNIGNHPNYLLLRVGASPKRVAVSLHAVATVRVGSRSMIRRVGSPGTAVSVSYIELLHFGLGWSQRADVTVRWTDGGIQTKRNIQANSFVIFGII